MDINIEGDFEEFDPFPVDAMLDITKSHYSIFFYFSTEHLQENVAFAVLAPSSNHVGGAVRVFSALGKPGQGFIKSPKILINKYARLRKLITIHRGAKLVWEGKLNGLNTRTKHNGYIWLN